MSSNPFGPVVKELQQIVKSLDELNDKSNVVLNKAEKILDETTPVLNKADDVMDKASKILRTVKTIEALLYIFIIALIAVVIGWFVTWFVTRIMHTRHSIKSM